MLISSFAVSFAPLSLSSSVDGFWTSKNIAIFLPVQKLWNSVKQPNKGQWCLQPACDCGERFATSITILCHLIQWSKSSHLIFSPPSCFELSCLIFSLLLSSPGQLSEHLQQLISLLRPNDRCSLVRNLVADCKFGLYFFVCVESKVSTLGVNNSSRRRWLWPAAEGCLAKCIALVA